MKKFPKMIPILVVLALLLAIPSASAEWLYATSGKTFIHPIPDTDSDRLGTFHVGEKIWVYSHIYTTDNRNWCQVLYNGQIAFISDKYSAYTVSNESSYVDIGSDSGDVLYYEEEDYEGTYYDDDDDDDYFYTYPEGDDYDDDVDSEFRYETEFTFVVTATKPVKVVQWYEGTEKMVIATVYNGDKLRGSRIYTSSDGKAWLRIYLEDRNEYGYVRTSKLRIQDGNFPELSQKMKVTGNTINVRSSADINSESKSIITLDTVITVDYFVCVNDGENRIWAHMTDERGGDLGFASCKFLTKG